MDSQKEFTRQGQVFHGHISNVMGTVFDLLTVGTAESVMDGIWQFICSRVEFLDHLLNRFDSGSEVFGLNSACNTQNQRVSDELHTMLLRCLDFNHRTGGLFDVAGGYMADVEISPDSPSVSLNGHQLDFGGYAKGAFMKECDAALRDGGVSCAFVNFGNSTITVIGHHPYGDCWKVGLNNTYTHAPLDEISLFDNTLSTSGNTPGYSGHIINPLTKERVEERKLACVISADPLEAEILSTALMIADEAHVSLLNSAFPDVSMKVYPM